MNREPIVVSEKYPHARLGRKIQSARLRKGLTQDQLATAAGITRRQMIRIEKGEHHPTEPVLARIGDATGKDTASLLDRKRRKPADDEEEAQAMDALDLELIGVLRKWRSAVTA